MKNLLAASRLGELSNAACLDSDDQRTIDLIQRFANLVFAAVDGEELRHAMGDALSEYNSFAQAEEAEERQLFACLTDSSIPVEVRHLMRAACYECIAQLVLQFATVEHRDLGEWMSAALREFVLAGERAGEALQNLSSKDCQALLDQHYGLVEEDGYEPPSLAELAALDADIRSAQEKPPVYLGSFAEYADDEA